MKHLTILSLICLSTNVALFAQPVVTYDEEGNEVVVWEEEEEGDVAVQGSPELRNPWAPPIVVE